MRTRNGNLCMCVAYNQMLNDSYSSAKAGRTHACVLCMGLATTIGGARAHAYKGDTDRGM